MQAVKDSQQHIYALLSAASGMGKRIVGHCAANPGADSQVTYETTYQVLLSGVERLSYNWDMIRSIAAPV